MRIKPEEQSLLRESVLRCLEGAEVFLFGSRVDDSLKGGDIDLLIRGDRKLSLVEKARIRADYARRFGERKLDLVSVKHGEEDAFTRLILEHAVALKEG